MAAQMHAQESTSTTVLVVDDESRIRALMKDALEEHADEVLEAQNGQEALSALARRRVNLILLDYYMPGMNGNQVCQQVREHFSELNLPIIMVTCNNDPRHLSKSLESGATDFIRKPFHLSEFRARVKTALRHQQQFSQQFERSSNDPIRNDAEIDPHSMSNSPKQEPNMFTKQAPITSQVQTNLPPEFAFHTEARSPRSYKPGMPLPEADAATPPRAWQEQSRGLGYEGHSEDAETLSVTVWIEGLILGKHTGLQVGDTRLFLRFDPLLFKLNDHLRIGMHTQVQADYPIEMMDAWVKRRTLAGIEVEVNGNLPRVLYN